MWMFDSGKTTCIPRIIHFIETVGSERDCRIASVRNVRACRTVVFLQTRTLFIMSFTWKAKKWLAVKTREYCFLAGLLFALRPHRITSSSSSAIPTKDICFFFSPATHLRIQFKKKYTRKSDSNANHLWDPWNPLAAKFSPLRSFGRTPIRIFVRYVCVEDTRRNCFVGDGRMMHNSTMSSFNAWNLNKFFYLSFYIKFLKKKKLNNFINTSSTQESSINFNKKVVYFLTLIVLQLQDSVLRVWDAKNRNFLFIIIRHLFYFFSKCFYFYFLKRLLFIAIKW